MGISMRNPGPIQAFKSVTAVNLPEGSLVAWSTSADYTVIMPSGASPTTPLAGLTYNITDPVTANLPIEIVQSGVWPGIAGATIAAGDELTSNGTDGTVKPIGTVTAGTNVAVIGQALEAAALGERVAIRINPYIKQG